MESFTPLLALLAEIEDPRRAEGKLYRLPHVILFAILAIVAGANSYRGIHSFLDVHLARLRDFFGLKWSRAPAYTTIRFILLRQLDAASVEPVFRRHATILHEKASQEPQRHVALDGKALRHSFDRFHDRKAAHILSAFVSNVGLVLAHLDCDEKSNEIPAVQALLRELGLEMTLLTVDAMHCQKNLRASRSCWRSPDRTGQGQPAHPASARRAGVSSQSSPRSAHQHGGEQAIASRNPIGRSVRPGRGSGRRRMA